MKRNLWMAVGACFALAYAAVADAAPDVCSNAYLWLDAAAPNTLTNVEGVVSEWRSVNAVGVSAATYSISGSSNAPTGPSVVTTNGLTLVSFGSTTANKDLSFPQATNIRAVFMVAKVEQSSDAFLLGDSSAYHFHRGASGQYWHSSHAAAGIRNGQTYRNGTLVSSPTSTVMPADLGLIEVYSTADLTASQLCYDRNGGDPRRGGKDIGELIIFTNTVSTLDQIAIRQYLLKKWGLNENALIYDTTAGVHRNDADLSGGVGLGDVFTQGAGSYGFKNVKLTGNVQGSGGYTLVVEEGDRIEIVDGDDLSGRNKFAWDIRGGSVVWPATASTWYENASFKQSGGTFTAQNTGTGMSGTGNGMLLGFNGSPAMTFDITGGLFTIPNSSLNFYNTCTFNVSSNGTVKVKGAYKSNKAGILNIEKGGTFALGSLGMTADAATVNLNGGTFGAYETTTMRAPIDVTDASSIYVPTGITLTVTSALSGAGTVRFHGGGKVVFSTQNPTCAYTVADDGTTVEPLLATVVRAHPRLTRGLDRESLIGVKFAHGAGGTLTNLVVRFDCTNCTPAQITDVRLWKQPHDPVPFAFFESQATNLGWVCRRGADTTGFAVTFSSTEGVTISPSTESQEESDYLWVTATIDKNIATNAEIWASIEGDSLYVSGQSYALVNARAAAPHRPFPYYYQIGAYVRQDRLVDNGKTTSDVFSNHPELRYPNLTDVIVIYHLTIGSTSSGYAFTAWDTGGYNDTASTAHIVANRNQYHPQCMVRGSITGKTFADAGASAATREQFATYVVNFCRAKGLDGIDLDYEWVNDSTNHAEWQKIGKMLRALSEHFFDAGLVLSLSTRLHDSTSSGMPYATEDYGAFHTADFITSQTYGGGNINAGHTIQTSGLNVCTKRGVPKRRVVLGQAMFSSQNQYGWDGAVGSIEAYVTDTLRRYDIDTTNPQSSSYAVFEGPSSYRGQCDWVRSEDIGGVMSWGYYCDVNWTGWASLGRHQAMSVWPLPPVDEASSPRQIGEATSSSLQNENIYLLSSESDWRWLFTHPAVSAQLTSDITFTHDPLAIANFSGTIDGAGHTLTIPADVWVTSGDKAGLIKVLSGTVKNLNIKLAGRVYTLAGRWNDPNQAASTVRVTNYTSGDNHTGVLAGEVASGGRIENCTVEIADGAEVKGVRYVGGLVGYVNDGATLASNKVTVAGIVHEEVRNTFDTLFTPTTPRVGAVYGKLAGSSATLIDNDYKLEATADLQNVDYIPPATWGSDVPVASLLKSEPITTPVSTYALNIGAGDWIAEVDFNLTNFAARATTEAYPQLVVASCGADGLISLSANRGNNCELFLTGSGTASYVYPISHAVIRGNGDVGSNIALAPKADGRVTLRLENHDGELRVVQNGSAILVTDKNSANGGSINRLVFGSGLDKLGGGVVEAVRFAALSPARLADHTLVWSDEFGGTNVDWTCWSKVPVLGSSAPNWRKNTSHREELTVVTNGTLVLTGIKNDGKDASETSDYLCGQIWGSGKLSFTKGTFEIRAKFDDQQGAWPALWMMPDCGNWPLGGEIDIEERLDAQTCVFQTVHHGPVTSGGNSTQNGSHDNTIDTGTWNVYRLEWNNDAITWYINGTKTFTYANDGTGSTDTWPFTTPFHFIFSEQLANHWQKTAVDDTTLPAHLYVDYVRVYQNPNVSGTCRMVRIEGDVDTNDLCVVADEDIGYRIDTAATLHLEGTGYQTFDAPLVGSGTLTLDAPGARVHVTNAAGFTGTIVGTDGTTVIRPTKLAGNNGNLVFTAVQTQSSYYRGKSEFQPLIGLEANTLSFTNLWRISVALPENVDPSIITDVKLYKTTTPYFAASLATDYWNGLEKSIGRTIKLSYQSSGKYPDIHAGEYLWVCAVIGGDAPANAVVDARISEVVVNGYYANVNNCDPYGYGTVYPYEYHVVPYWRTQDWTLSALTHQHFACYTEVIPFFINVNADGSVTRPWYDASDAAYRAKIDKIKALRGDHDVRLLAGVGFSQNQLPTVCADATIRAKAARNLADFVERFGLDGIDFDWEYPTTAAHWGGWCLLVSDLKRALMELPGGKQVSIAVTGYRTYEGGNSLNPNGVAGLFQQCDFVNMMSYDGSEAAGHATLALMQNDFTRAATYGHIPTYKICGGQAFYTNHYPTDGSQNGYNWVVNNYPQYIDSTDVFTGTDGKVYTYNSIATIKSKCADAKSRGGGAMIWANETDVALSNPKSATRAMFSQITPSRAKAGEGDLTITDATDWPFICSAKGTIDLAADLTIDSSVLHAAELKGTFNGNGHTIYVSDEPLFTKVSGVFSNANIVVTGDITGNGVVCATLENCGEIADLTVTIPESAAITGTGCCGGVAGEIWAGLATSTASVRDCTVYLNGTLTATQYGRVGGVVGHFNTANSPTGVGIYDCVVYLGGTAQLVAGSGTTTWSAIGGILGNDNNRTSVIDGDYVFETAGATMTGTTRTGTIVGGCCWGGTVTGVTNCTSATIAAVSDYRLPSAPTNLPVTVALGHAYATAAALVDLTSVTNGERVMSLNYADKQIVLTAYRTLGNRLVTLRQGWVNSSGTLAESANYGSDVNLAPGIYSLALTEYPWVGTSLYVDGALATTGAKLVFSSDTVVSATFGGGAVPLYAWDAATNACYAITYPKTATYDEGNIFEIGTDGEGWTVGPFVYPGTNTSFTVNALVDLPGTTNTPLVATTMRQNSTDWTTIAYTPNGATGEKVVNFTHSISSGTTAALNGINQLNDATLKYGGSYLTRLTLGGDAGTIIGTRQVFLGAATQPTTEDPFSGIVEAPAWYTGLGNTTAKSYYLDTLGLDLVSYNPADVTVNGETKSGSAAAEMRWLFGTDLAGETNLTFSLAAPAVADGQVGITLAGSDPINAALKLQNAAQPSGPWTTAAEIAAGTENRSFLFATDDEKSFYQLVTADSVTAPVTQGMPVSLTSAQKVNMGNLTITESDITAGKLTVQLAGAGVQAGLRAALVVNGTALVAHSTADGTLTFDLTACAARTPYQSVEAQLNLYTSGGLTNGDLYVSSPAVSGLTYSPAVLTAMVADGLKVDGFTTVSGFGNYRIPALVSDGEGEVIACYDVRYGGGDLGTGDGIDIGESYSADAGQSFATPRLAVDVPNTRDENQISHGYAITNDLGDVALLYDYATETYWMMGMTGQGLNVGDYYKNDVVLYKRGKGRNAAWTPWKNPAIASDDPMTYRSVKATIAAQDGIANSSGGYRFGFLEGPGHGFVSSKGWLVFPMQYFVDGWASTVGAVYSKDHGQTWIATKRSSGGTTPQENCVMELDDGSWYMTTKAGSRPGTGRINFFRTTDYTNWTYVGEYYPVPCQQGSCLRLGRNGEGVGQYVLCHTLHPDTATRARVALVFGTDTTASGDTAGVSWDFTKPLMLYYDNTGFKGYNSLTMLDDRTLGVLYEAQGHIYFIRIDVSDKLK